MVVSLGPGKFYGSSLPRPRIYTDVKFNDTRVDPPVPVLDPFMTWAEEAHWSMGGLSFTRHRLQGRIEGNIEKLRAEREKTFKKRKLSAASVDEDDDRIGGDSPPPPPAPIVSKRRRFMALIEEEEDVEDDKSVGVRVSRRSARKLGDDFDRVAVESGLGESSGSPQKSGGGPGTVASRTRSRRSEKEEETADDVVEEVTKPKSNGKKLKKRSGENGGGVRTSPRLLKRGLN